MVCQRDNLDRWVRKDSPFYSVGHIHWPILSATLLRTCRLIYYETHALVMRSYTCHIFETDNTGPGYTSKKLYHLSSQLGRHIYHLHYTRVNNFATINTMAFWFSRFPSHLRWRRVTFTMRLDREIKRRAWLEDTGVNQLTECCSKLLLPSSAAEFAIEFQILQSPEQFREFHDLVLELCKGSAGQVRREDGAILSFDVEDSKRYSWVGDNGWFSNVRYRCLRLCWKSEDWKARVREDRRYDYSQCLEAGNLYSVTGTSKIEATES